MEKKLFIKPYVEVISTKENNIITTSGPIPAKLTDALFGAGKDGVNVG